jgi:hypothetical protein
VAQPGTSRRARITVAKPKLVRFTIAAARRDPGLNPRNQVGDA